MEPAGFIVHPFPEVGNLRLLDVLDRFCVELDSSSGRRIGWRPIDNPRKTGKVYEEMRTRKRAAIDEAAIEQYDREIVDSGGLAHLQRRSIDELATKFGVSAQSRPCLLFVAHPDYVDHPRLPIPLTLLESQSAQDIFAKIIIESITEISVANVAEYGVLTASSMKRYQDYLSTVHDQLLRAEATICGSTCVHPPRTNPYSYSFHDNRHVVAISQEKRRQILSNLDDWDLMLDCVGGTARCTLNGVLRPLRVTPRGLQIVAEVMVSDVPISPGETRTGRACASPHSALTQFHSAKSIIFRSFREVFDPFRGSRGLDRDHRRFEFTPPDDFRWAVILAL